MATREASGLCAWLPVARWDSAALEVLSQRDGPSPERRSTATYTQSNFPRFQTGDLQIQPGITMTQTSLPTCQSGSWGPHRPPRGWWPLPSSTGAPRLSPVQRAQRRTSGSRVELTPSPSPWGGGAAHGRARVGVGILGLSHK